jgi:hypothetical protein|tara:strand:- start:64 stop:240 length:177 start_codon:yes stop_codon:yes gene_type:complete
MPLTVDIFDKAKKFTVLVECLQRVADDFDERYHKTNVGGPPPLVGRTALGKTGVVLPT